MYERFTCNARKVMQLCTQEAQRREHREINSEHILISLLRLEQGVGCEALSQLGIELDGVRDLVDQYVIKGEEFVSGKVPLSHEATEIMDYAQQEAKQLYHQYLGTEHLLLGLIRLEKSVSSRMFDALGIEQKQIRDEIYGILGVNPEK